MNASVIISFIAVILSLVFVALRAFRGHPPFLNCLIAVVFICMVSGLDVSSSIATAFAIDLYPAPITWRTVGHAAAGHARAALIVKNKVSKLMNKGVTKWLNQMLFVMKDM